jgi:hypothetical protein
MATVRCPAATCRILALVGRLAERLGGHAGRCGRRRRSGTMTLAGADAFSRCRRAAAEPPTPAQARSTPRCSTAAHASPTWSAPTAAASAREEEWSRCAAPGGAERWRGAQPVQLAKGRAHGGSGARSSTRRCDCNATISHAPPRAHRAPRAQRGSIGTACSARSARSACSARSLCSARPGRPSGGPGLGLAQLPHNESGARRRLRPPCP